MNARRKAQSSLDPKIDLEQQSYDSVAAGSSAFGLRVPEFVIYKKEQCTPRYILSVSQARPASLPRIHTLHPSASLPLPPHTSPRLPLPKPHRPPLPRGHSPFVPRPRISG